MDPDRTQAAEGSHPVILFDGVCNLCDHSVNFIIDRDPTAHFRFAALQSEAGGRILRAHGKAPPVGDPSSILLVEGGAVYDASTAALRIARQMRGVTRLLTPFILVPRPIRDFVYRFIAEHRYTWFGKSDVCRVPTPELRARFLDP